MENIYELEEKLEELNLQTQTSKLEAAKLLIEKSIDLLTEVNTGELKSYYGYSIELMVQELIKISDNHRGYLTRDTNLEEIISTEGENWNEE